LRSKQLDKKDFLPFDFLKALVPNRILSLTSLTNQSSSLDTTLTGWTTQLNTDDLLEFYVSQSSLYITDLTIFIDIQARQ
jgi:hypothetical protein